MNNVISITEWKNKQLEKQYTAYHGTPIDIKYVKRPSLTVVENNTNITDIMAQPNYVAYMNQVQEELQSEGIDTDTINIIKPDPTIPW